METEDALSALTALGHPSRLAAFRTLVQAGPQGLAVGEVRERLNLPPATLSAHLNVLRAAGLVRDAREGRVIRVHAAYARMNALVDYLMENCCGGTSQRSAAVCRPTATRNRNAAVGPARKAHAGKSGAPASAVRKTGVRKAVSRAAKGASR